MNNYEEQIKKLKEHIAKLEAELKETKVKRWLPMYGDLYYFVSDGTIGSCCWNDSCFDDDKYLTQNCFKTYEEAEEHKIEIKTYFKFKNYVEEHSEPLDWNNDCQKKFRCYYDFYENMIDYDYVMACCKDQGTIYASSEQILKDAIDYIGGEEVAKRYLFGIKE